LGWVNRPVIMAGADRLARVAQPNEAKLTRVQTQ
jgi:hypothetical protein